MAEDIRLIAYVTAKSGLEDAVRDAMLACVPPTRAERGNLMYVLHHDAADAATFVLVEHWQSQAALDHHMSLPHFKNLVAFLDGKLAAPVVMHTLKPV